MNGPFSFAPGSGPDFFWDIQDADGIPVAAITSQLIDGSNREKYKARNGVIRTREERAADAKWVLYALNAAYYRDKEHA